MNLIWLCIITSFMSAFLSVYKGLERVFPRIWILHNICACRMRPFDVWQIQGHDILHQGHWAIRLFTLILEIWYGCENLGRKMPPVCRAQSQLSQTQRNEVPCQVRFYLQLNEYLKQQKNRIIFTQEEHQKIRELRMVRYQKILILRVLCMK